MSLTSIELCAGGGGQALGIEQAGFEHLTLVEREEAFCQTLRLNRPNWNVERLDLREFPQSRAAQFKGVDLLAAGLPCPPFSKAGKQLGADDERNLFPTAIEIINICRPRAVMIENVRGLLDAVFEDYRNGIERQLKKLGYAPSWALLNASEFGVPQLRPRVVFVAVQKKLAGHLNFPPQPVPGPRRTVGETLYPLMASRGWKGAAKWREQSSEVAPTIVGGSTKHGGPDLGPTRAKRAWLALGVNGMKIADAAPDSDFVGNPYLTVQMVALLQGFPPDWRFHGKKTIAYRQVGNAFPPPVAKAVATEIHACLTRRTLVAVPG